MKFLVGFALFATAIGVPVKAQEKRWFELDASTRQVTSVDAFTVEPLGDSTYRAWIRHTYTAPKRIRGAEYWVILSLFEIDCRHSYLRLGRTVLRDSMGEVIDDETDPNPARHRAVPGSVGESLFNTGCAVFPTLVQLRTEPVADDYTDPVAAYIRRYRLTP